MSDFTVFDDVSKSCPVSTEEQLKAEKDLRCPIDTKYHCMRNERGLLGEICMEPSWIQKDYCPEYNIAAGKLDADRCNKTLGICPPKTFLSNEVLAYSSCVRSLAPQPKTSTPIISPATTRSPSDTHHTTTAPSSTPTFPVTAVMVSLVIITFVSIVVLGVICWKRRQRKQSEGSADEQQQMVDIEGFLEEPKMCDYIGLSKKEQRKIGSQGKQVLITQQEEEEEHNIFLVPDEKAVCSETENEKFVRTFQFSKIKEHIQKGEFVLILGDMGAGKTTTCQMLCHEFHHGIVLEREVKCRIINSLENRSFKLNPRNSHLLFLDDCFEHWNYFPDQREKDIELIQEMYYKRRKHCVVVMAMTNLTWRVHAQNIIGLKCFANVVKLSDLSDIEKKEILKVQMKLHGIPVETEFSDLMQNNELPEGKKENTSSYKLSVGYPLICKIFCSARTMSVVLGKKYFEDPVSVLIDDIQSLRTSENQQDVDHYVTLVYILLRGVLDVQTQDEVLLTDIRNKCKKVNEKYETDRPFQFNRKSYYLSDNGKGNLVFINDFVHRIVMLNFTTRQTIFYIKYCREDYLLQHTQIEETTRKSPLKYWCLLITPNLYKLLSRRLKTIGQSVEGHVVFQDEKFRSKYEQA